MELYGESVEVPCIAFQNLVFHDLLLRTCTMTESRAIATASTSTLGMYLPSTNPDKLRAHLK